MARYSIPAEQDGKWFELPFNCELEIEGFRCGFVICPECSIGLRQVSDDGRTAEVAGPWGDTYQCGSFICDTSSRSMLDKLQDAKEAGRYFSLSIGDIIDTQAGSFRIVELSRRRSLGGEFGLEIVR